MPAHRRATRPRVAGDPLVASDSATSSSRLMTSSIVRNRLVVGALKHLAKDGVGGLVRLVRTMRVVASRRSISYAASAATGSSFASNAVVSARASRMACPARRAARHHRMRRVAEQRDPIEAPARQRVLIDHREFQTLSAARINAGTSSQSKCQAAKGTDEIVDRTLPVPVRVCDRSGFQFRPPR